MQCRSMRPTCLTMTRVSARQVATISILKHSEVRRLASSGPVSLCGDGVTAMLEVATALQGDDGARKEDDLATGRSEFMPA